MDKPVLSAKTVCDRARELATPEQRQAYLNEICGDDAELRRQVEALLQANDEAGDSVDKPAIDTKATSDIAPGRWLDAGNLPAAPLESAGSRIGPYKLLRQIGEGGMGIVWMAEQEQPVRRKVALKVIKAGMDSAQVVARFEAERQALALMDHPNIARIHDGGATPTGRPFFVMELVKGVPLTKYCDDNRLSPRQRLELFVPVCQAIQHAHQKGVIHRDIKPSNVLIASSDGRPAPKVIDFGLAKAAGPRLTEKTLFTEFGAVLGTLEYMSPEQAELNNQDIDTRCDVYSLGVLLYELLTGTTPLNRKPGQDASLTEVLRRIREEEAAKPSVRLSESKDSLAMLAARRQTEPAKLTKLLRGELDWIVMKALEKERSRRYETANSLAADVLHYLADEPVSAGPPSAGYRLRKLARRHKRALATAAALLLLLFLGVVVSTSLAVWALRERDRAVRAEEDAETRRDRAVAAEEASKRSEEDAQAVLRYFQDKVLSAGRPAGQQGGRGKDVTLRQAVDAAEPGIAESFQDRPLVEASIRSTLGTTYYYLGEPRLAIRQLEKALALSEAKRGADHDDTLNFRSSLAVACQLAGRTDEAIRLHELNLKLREAKRGADHLDTLKSRNNLANAYLDAGRIDEAIRLHEPNLQRLESQFGASHLLTMQARNNLANAYTSADRPADAIPLYEQNLKQRESQLGANHPQTLFSRNNLALAYVAADRGADAIRLYESNIPRMEAKLGADHPYTLSARQSLGMAYLSTGRTAESIRLLERNLKQSEAKLGVDHPHTLTSRVSLAQANQQVGRISEAIRLFEQTLKLQKAKLGPRHFQVARTLAGLGACLLEDKKYDDAEPLLRECLQIREAAESDAWTTFYTRSLLGWALLGQKKYADAEPLLLKGYEGMEERQAKIPSQFKMRLSEALQRLVQLYEAMGNKDQAEKWRTQREKTRKVDAKDADKK